MVDKTMIGEAALRGCWNDVFLYGYCNRDASDREAMFVVGDIYGFIYKKYI
jgi:hypothetical protein